jgi:hypothetical protein
VGLCRLVQILNFKLQSCIVNFKFAVEGAVFESSEEVSVAVAVFERLKKLQLQLQSQFLRG